MPEVSFVDSNVFIYVMLKDPRYGPTALNILLRFEEGEEAGVTSTLVLSPVMAHLVRRKRWSAIDVFYEYLENVPIRIVETTPRDFQEAGRLRKALELPWSLWDDLVIASQMRRLKVERIYSNDSDFDVIEGVERVFS